MISRRRPPRPPIFGWRPRAGAEAARAASGRTAGRARPVIERHAPRNLPITHRVVILDRGRLVAEGASTEMLAQPALLECHLGLALHP